MGMNGIILVDKPCGWTSHDVVGKLRGILHERRIGHSGTLDPMATGLLVVFAGRATRAVEFAEADSKEYTRIEYAYSLMAKAAKINMAECRLVETKEGTHFATKRFDREEVTGRIPPAMF